MDIALKDWTDDLLPQISIDVGWATLFKQLQNIMQSKNKDHEIGDLFQPLKANILETVQADHTWQANALKRLVSTSCVYIAIHYYTLLYIATRCL